MMEYFVGALALISFALIMFIAMWSRAAMMTGRQHDVKTIHQHS